MVNKYDELHMTQSEVDSFNKAILNVSMYNNIWQLQINVNGQVNFTNVFETDGTFEKPLTIQDLFTEARYLRRTLSVDNFENDDIKGYVTCMVLSRYLQTLGRLKNLNKQWECD